MQAPGAVRPGGRFVRVRTVDRTGQVRERAAADFVVGYREVVGPPGEWFLDAELVLAPGDGKAGMARIRELLDRRAETQPVGLPSCGSVFRNPPGDHAARLIEARGSRVTGSEALRCPRSMRISSSIRARPVRPTSASSSTWSSIGSSRHRGQTGARGQGASPEIIHDNAGSPGRRSVWKGRGADGRARG
jgi:hypothetical protein